MNKNNEWKIIDLNDNDHDWILSMKQRIEGVLPSLHLEYRDKEPKQPTHEEIMTKWWNTFNKIWVKVQSTNIYNGNIVYMTHTNGIHEGFFRACDFINMESADIPPEAKE